MPGKIRDLIRASTGEGFGQVPKKLRASTVEGFGQVPKKLRASTGEGSGRVPENGGIRAIELGHDAKEPPN